eukprot:12919961-Prorocentrum_lima.AAC.1
MAHALPSRNAKKDEVDGQKVVKEYSVSTAAALGLLARWGNTLRTKRCQAKAKEALALLLRGCHAACGMQ